MYRITIERLANGEPVEPGTNASSVVKLYEQTVEGELSLPAIISAINKTPRKSRAKSAQSEQAKSGGRT